MSNTNYDRLIEKVQKLLALAGNNPSEEEATAAALKAQELISQYNLELPEDASKVEMIHLGHYTGKGNTWKLVLGATIANNFRCRIYWYAGFEECVFFGYKHDAETASAVFKYLFDVADKKAKAYSMKIYRMTGSKAGVALSYCEGFNRGIKAALDTQSVALMVITPPEVEEGYDEWASDVKVRTRNVPSAFRYGYNAEALNQGIQDGKDAMGRKQLAGSPA